jgi:hypothetical protein
VLAIALIFVLVLHFFDLLRFIVCVSIATVYVTPPSLIIYHAFNFMSIFIPIYAAYQERKITAAKGKE